MSAPIHLCSRCGTPLAASGVACPVCALDAALDLGDPTEPETDGGAWDDLLIPVRAPLSGEKKRFGRFDLLGEVGRGGMGVVYRAKEENSPRIVALKVILPQSAAVPGMIGRFRAEAGAVASLDHPHILPLYSSGEREGLPFFSMKLAGGGSLAAKLREYAGRPREAAKLIASIAHAVHHAHQRGILHRDLKPANILLDEQGVPYVADFGIAKWIGQDQSMTLTGVTLGTPTYMAPEQAAGKSDDLTVAADVYSLGAILYEMLVQRPPFWAHTTLDLLRQVADQPPPTLRSIRPEISRDLETICLKCLAKEPAGRYASAEALAADLEAWLEDRPIAARPIGRGEKFVRWSRRNPALAILNAIVFALVLSSMVGTGLALHRIAQERNEAMTQLRASLLAQARAAQLSGLIGQRFEALEALKKAAAISPGLDLRDEALAALALPDARFAFAWNSRYASNSPVAFDSTGERFVVESAEGILTLHRTSDGALLREYTSEAKHPRALYIAPLAADDGRFAVRFDDDRVAVYALDQEKPLWQLTGRPVCQINPAFAYDFAITPDSREVAVGLPGGGLSFHDATTGKETSRLKFAFPPSVVTFSPDGKKVAVAELRTRDLIIHDRSTGKELRRINHPKSVIHAAWSPDGQQLAVACFDNRIYLWDPATGAQNSVLRGHAETPTLLAWRDDSRVLASTGRDSTLRLWDADDGAPLLTLPQISGEPCLRFSRDGRSLGYAGETNSLGRLDLHIGDIRSEWVHGTPGNYFSTRGGMDVSADGRLLAVAYNSGIRLYDAHSGALLGPLPLAREGQKTVQFTPKGDGLVYSCEENGTWIRSIVWKGAQELEIGPVRPVDGRKGFFVTEIRGEPPRVALLGEDLGIASIIGLSGGKPVDMTLAGSPENCSLHPTEPVAATSDREGEKGGDSDVKLWNDVTGKFQRRLNLGPNGSARFSPDGRLLWASGGERSGLLHWPDLTPVTAKPPLLGCDAWFSPDQSMLAVSDLDKIALFRLGDSQMLGRLPASIIAYARFAPDGGRLFTFANFNIYAWDLRAVRRELAAVGLDWDGPPIPPPGPAETIRVTW